MNEEHETVERQVIEQFKTFVANKQNYLILDTETTGLDGVAEVVEVSIIDLDENVIFDKLIKPKIPLTAELTDIHGISNEMLVDAPTFNEVYEEIRQILNGKIMLIYNANFDFRILNQSAAHYGLPRFNIHYHCVMMWYAEYFGDWNEYKQSYRWQKLVNAADAESVDLTDLTLHRAKADCIATARLIKKIAAII